MIHHSLVRAGCLFSSIAKARKFHHSLSVLVIYCCVTNYPPELSGLKQHRLAVSQFLWAGVSKAWLCPLLQDLPQAAVDQSRISLQAHSVMGRSLSLLGLLEQNTTD